MKQKHIMLREKQAVSEYTPFYSEIIGKLKVNCENLFLGPVRIGPGREFGRKNMKSKMTVTDWGASLNHHSETLRIL